ncbi:MAG: hypothetical protein AAGA72_18005 [Pseudomonadota bacterium]
MSALGQMQTLAQRLTSGRLWPFVAVCWISRQRPKRSSQQTWPPPYGGSGQISLPSRGMPRLRKGRLRHWRARQELLSANSNGGVDINTDYRAQLSGVYNKTVILLVHGIGFHEPNTGKISVEKLLDSHELETQTTVEKVVWSHSSDKYIDRDSFLGLVRALAYVCRLSVYEIWNTRIIASKKFRDLLSEIMFAFLFAALLVEMLVFGATVLSAVFGFISIESHIFFSAMSMLISPAMILIIVNLIPPHKKQIFNTLRFLFIYAALLVLFPVIFIFFCIRHLGKPALYIFGFPLGMIAYIAIVLNITGVEFPESEVVVEDGIASTRVIPDANRSPFSFLATTLVISIICIFGVSAAIRFFRLDSLWVRYVGGFMKKLSELAKFVSDIALYFGHRKFRDGLVDQLTRTCVSLPPETTIVLCGHSLGSVIVVDTLSRMRRLPQEVLIVTGGSPLQRWLHKFVGNEYPDCAKSQSLLLNRHNARWFNVYRVADPIGAALSLEEDGDIDVSGIEFRGTWDIQAHYDYWSDQSIVEAILARIQSSSRSS